MQEEAKRLEQLRDDHQHHSQTFGMAVIFLQLSILLSSVAGLFKKKAIWALAVCLGSVGVGVFGNGFFDWF